MLRKLSGIFLSKNNIFRSFSSGTLVNIEGDNAEKNTKEEDYSYLLILDFEATCDKHFKIEQEIIEFPCLKVNAKTLKEESRFHYYVRPVVNPNLTEFCTNLTGIMQGVVDNAHIFKDVLQFFEEWRERENLTDDNSIYITSGDWDLGYMIPGQCSLDGLEIPSHMTRWIDLKKMYGNNFNHYYNSFAEIMKIFKFEFIGRPHSGIDDCLNMLRIVERFGQLGLKFHPTSKLVNVDSNWKVHVIGSKKFITPSIWQKRKVPSP